jgi:hypothetical protein
MMQIKDFDVGDLVDKKNARRYDDCLSYTMVASKKALQQAGLEKGANADGHGALDKSRVGVLVGSGMGGLTGEKQAGAGGGWGWGWGSWESSERSSSGMLGWQAGGTHVKSCVAAYPCVCCFLPLLLLAT